MSTGYRSPLSGAVEDSSQEATWREYRHLADRARTSERRITRFLRAGDGLVYYFGQIDGRWKWLAIVIDVSC